MISGSPEADHQGRHAGRRARCGARGASKILGQRAGGVLGKATIDRRDFGLVEPGAESGGVMVGERLKVEIGSGRAPMRRRLREPSEPSRKGRRGRDGTHKIRSPHEYGVAPPAFRLPDGTHVGAGIACGRPAAVTDYYRRVIGLHVMESAPDTGVARCPGEPSLVVLHAAPGSRPAPRRVSSALSLRHPAAGTGRAGAVRRAPVSPRPPRGHVRSPGERSALPHRSRRARDRGVRRPTSECWRHAERQLRGGKIR
jgi:hypothetical protein